MQLPVFNERFVVARLIEAAAALDYPRLHVQVLDDSTDDTSEIAAATVARLRAGGVRIDHIRRSSRLGFKAGALQAGLEATQAQFIALFDADFVPQPDFLRRMVPWFADPQVGLVQARWGHLNHLASWLTAAQALLLDAHFAVEHAARHRVGRWFNFNGTAGVWRRDAMIAAGGWQHDTLTEDLDLSYRAQLAGWRFVYDDEVVAPAELPSTFSAFKAQQHRWAKGSVQTMRKLLPQIWRSAVPLNTKIEATFHLSGNLAYPLTLALAVAMPVAAGARWWWVDLTMFVAGTASVVLFHLAAIAACGGPWRRVGVIPVAMALGAGMSVNQTRAVVEGLVGRTGTFVRTPKQGDQTSVTTRRYALPVHRAVLVERLLSAWLVFGLGWVIVRGVYWSVPFLAMFTAGFLAVGWGSVDRSSNSPSSPG